MLELRATNGFWQQRFELPVLYNSAHIILLRRTLLIRKPGAYRDEARLALHLTDQVTASGGFARYPGGQASASMTRLAVAALRAAVGEKTLPGAFGEAPETNPEIRPSLRGRIDVAISRAERYLSGVPSRRDLTDALDSVFFERLLLASDVPAGLLFFEPEFVAWAHSAEWKRRLQRHAGRHARHAVPAISILYRSARRQRRTGRLPPALSHSIGVFRRLEERSIQELIRLILSRQNPDGGWFYSSYLTTMNLLALNAAGVPCDDPAVERAAGWLRERLFETADGGLSLSPWKADIWDTSLGILSYLRVPGTRSDDPEIAAAVEHLLGDQQRDGSFAWGSGAANDTDSVSTALALRSLALAAESASGGRLSAIEDALRRGIEFLVAHQDPRGGYSVWDPTAVTAHSGPIGVATQLLFDVASADTTARVLSALAAAGLTVDHPVVRGALGFLIRNQSDDGAWWCRWWAGYLAGTGFVLEAMAALGLGVGVQPTSDDPLVRRARRSLARGVRFLLDHQNPDGGWGETTAADLDPRSAATGASRPLQTAFAVSALLSCGLPADSEAVDDGIEYLLRAADRDGLWRDDQVTFTIFSRWWYYRYPLYSATLPLDAITRFLDARSDRDRERTFPVEGI
jgi:squalene-hopene/tetraprenyl-beta-curcumene cyclase